MLETPQQAAEAMYAALSCGDIGWFQAHLLDSPVATHVGPGTHYWMSHGQFLSELSRQFAEVSMTWTPGDLACQPAGSVAWIADRPTVTFDDGSSLLARVSLVFVRPRRHWHLAHSHLSHPVD